MANMSQGSGDNRRGVGAGGVGVRKQYPLNDMENYIHDTIMYMIELLTADSCDNCCLDLTKITLELCKRGNTKPLKKVTCGDSVEERVLSFVWQHPAIFEVKDGKLISLRPMSIDVDDKLEENLIQRTIDFLVFRCNQYGPCQILISRLFGNLHQAANDIKHHFHNDYSRFCTFLQSRDDTFVLIDGSYVALKTVYDDSIAKNQRLLKCDEYLIDGRVLSCTELVTNVDNGQEIINFVLNTQKVVAIDCEGVNLGAPSGFITLVQMAFVNQTSPAFSLDNIASSIEIYLFDIQADRRLLTVWLKKLLQSDKVIKIFQGCASDSTALQSKYGITLRYVFDTVIAHRYLHEGVKSDLYYLYEFYVGEVTNRMKKDIKKQYIGNPRLWTTRPLTEPLTYYAAFDVYALIRIYFAMLPQLNQNAYETILRRSNGVAISAGKRNPPASTSYHAQRGWSHDRRDNSGSSYPAPSGEQVNGSSYQTNQGYYQYRQQQQPQAQPQPGYSQDPSSSYRSFRPNKHGFRGRGGGGPFSHNYNSNYQRYSDNYSQPRHNTYRPYKSTTNYSSQPQQPGQYQQHRYPRPSIPQSQYHQQNQYNYGTQRQNHQQPQPQQQHHHQQLQPQQQQQYQPQQRRGGDWKSSHPMRRKEGELRRPGWNNYANHQSNRSGRESNDGPSSIVNQQSNDVCYSLSVFTNPDSYNEDRENGYQSNQPNNHV